MYFVLCDVVCCIASDGRLLLVFFSFSQVSFRRLLPLNKFAKHLFCLLGWWAGVAVRRLRCVSSVAGVRTHEAAADTTAFGTD